ncbi:MAG: hypothetical protein ACRBC3_05035 [Burkholderiaceae bacterium]
MNLFLSLEPLRLVLLFAHLICCGFAITYVLHADLTIARAKFSRQWIARTATVISRWLIALWFTGLALIWIDTGFELPALISKPKLLLKLLCVVVLTINGLFLHYLSFPVLVRSGPLGAGNSMLLAITGGLSTSHWLIAAFVGVAKPLGQLPFDLLLKAYLVIVGATIVIALASTPVVRHRVTGWRLKETFR